MVFFFQKFLRNFTNLNSMKNIRYIIFLISRFLESESLANTETPFKIGQCPETNLKFYIHDQNIFFWKVGSLNKVDQIRLGQSSQVGKVG